MAGSSDPGVGHRHWAAWIGGGLVVAAVLYAFPLFHVVRLNDPANAAAPAVAGAIGAPFNAAEVAALLWRTKLVPAAATAPALAPMVAAIRADPAAAVHRYGHEVGIGGTAYFFVRGRGRLIARTPDAARIALDGGSGAVVEVVTGPVFGNTVRDGTGLLNVNDFPGLEEFNAVAAELNRRVEADVEPVVRRAGIGTDVEFAGCAEVPDHVAEGPPLLTIVPITAATAAGAHD